MREGVTFGFDEGGCEDVIFRADLDHLNFSEVETGEVIAFLKEGITNPIIVTNDALEVVTDNFFEIKGDKLIAKKMLIPSMATLDKVIIETDCLFYLMEDVIL